MRMIGYYAVRSFLNQLKKIFKTWVLVFILACALIGGLIGAGIGALSNAAEESQSESAEEFLPGEFSEFEGAEELPEESAEDTGENFPAVISAAPDTPPEKFKTEVFELILGALLLGIFVFLILSADKSGGKIFLPADVNLLFPSPLRPQSVLFFRLLMQAGAAVFASIYLLFQIPNLIFNVGLSPAAAFIMLLVWFLMILTGKFLQVLLYTVTATRTGTKKYIAPAVYAVLGITAAAWLVFWQTSKMTPLDAAFAFFNSKYSRFIPIWGWLKGIVMFTTEKNAALTILCLVLTAAALGALILLIRSVKADFYEDAMARSEQTAELMEAMASGRKIRSKRADKKDKSEKLRRDGLSRGSGANMFFHKSLYNRFRFAKLGIFTKTSWTYLAAAALTAVLSRLVINTKTPYIVIFTITVLVFYRSMRNPLEEDTKMDFFRLIPESSLKKVFWSLLAGTVNCVLDAVPALILASLIIGANPLLFLAWLPFIAAVDFYSTNTSTFINLAVPASVDKTIKQVVTIMFLYFGLLPCAAIMAVAAVLGNIYAGAVITVLVCAGLGMLFMLLSASLLEPFGGRQRTAALRSVDLSEVKKQISRIGFGLLGILCALLALRYAVSLILNMAVPAWENNILLQWLYRSLPLYAAAIPFGLKIMKKVPAEKLYVRPMPLRKWFTAFFCCIFMMYVCNAVGVVIMMALHPGASPETLNPLYEVLSGSSKFLQLLFTCVLAPVFEELVFRKALIDRLHPYGERLAIVTSALCFGLFHLNLQQFLYATALGLVFGYVYTRTGQLRWSVALHMAINFTGNIASLLLFGENSSLLDNLSSGDPALISEALRSPRMIALLLYLAVIFISWIIGLVLFIINVRRLIFEPTVQQLPRGTGFRTVGTSPGILLFALACTGHIIYLLFL